MAAVVLARYAVSALGTGDAAFDVGRPGEAPRVAIARDAVLARAGLARPMCARAVLAPHGDEDPALCLLREAIVGCADALDRSDPEWRTARVGIAVGTSAGAMHTTQRFLALRAAGGVPAPELARGAVYFAPLAPAIRAAGIRPAAVAHVLAACASSTMAIGLGMRWLRLGRCDVVLAGGYDAVAEFVAAGFEALGATCAGRPRPFRVGRDGMALGEGAAIFAMGPPGRGARPCAVFLGGFGAATDALHVTAPDPTGAGLARAARRALDDARVDPATIDLVGAHATATPQNDVAEAAALRRAIGTATDPAVHPFKAQIGHALGAAGALELGAIVRAMETGVVPAAAGDGELDPACAVRLLPRTAAGTVRAALKLSAGFGGVDAALVATRERPCVVSGGARPVRVAGWTATERPLADGDLRAATGLPEAHLGRLDGVARLALSAVARLRDALGAESFAGAGVVLGHALATLEANEAFDRRRRERGAGRVEARRFPATSPNLAAAECAIAFGLTGPGLAVGASLCGAVEAFAVGADLVAAGDADRMVVVAADATGEASHDLLRFAGWPDLAPGACAALIVPAGPGDPRIATRAMPFREDGVGEDIPGWRGLQAALRDGPRG